MRERLDDTRRRELLEVFLVSRGQLVATARSVLRCAVRADDIVQDVVIKICQNEIGTDVRDPRIYLKRMVRNLAVDFLRRSQREYRQTAPEADAYELAAPATDPQDRLEAREALRTVVTTLRSAPERTRNVFIANRLRGVPQKVIAAQAGVSPTLVNFIIRDATALCRKAVEPSGTLEVKRYPKPHSGIAANDRCRLTSTTAPFSSFTHRSATSK
ncbi:RNA polymerase sigma-70 factor, ECF subfamily [Arboricoccus pini]|uniref:RNA polymerase sigma-70 factor, ECF subfamily n=1 Tax=Arboricoccus pini TaxID=1963835 RepID=A0A212RLK8_9PROT|nr:sigma-70 family RNA polymerase sigma factor [Arboricoccus pini]SNB73364.1 RNA polymerase sigma-70 factor, ECF subfamily [Arboricoccus pini]